MFVEKKLRKKREQGQFHCKAIILQANKINSLPHLDRCQSTWLGEKTMEFIILVCLIDNHKTIKSNLSRSGVIKLQPWLLVFVKKVLLKAKHGGTFL